MRKHNSTLETHCKIMKQINKQDKTYINTLENHDEHETTSKRHRKNIEKHNKYWKTLKNMNEHEET